MPLSTAEVNALRPVVMREGLDNFVDEVRDLAIAEKRAAALTALGSAVSVTVSNWQTPAAYVASATSATLPSVIDDITAAWAARDQSKLGSLFVQLYAAAKAHLGR